MRQQDRSITALAIRHEELLALMAKLLKDTPIARRADRRCFYANRTDVYSNVDHAVVSS
jgi:hypothetical protein